MTHGIFGGDSAPVLRFRSSPLDVPHDASLMTFLSTAQQIARSSRQDPRGHIIAIALAGAISIGATLFNVPTAAIRMKIQRHSGPQERIDLSFAFPSLEASDVPKHVSADTV